MDTSSLDVRFYPVETNKRAKGKTYTIRWKVAHKKHSKTYKKIAVADDERSKLMSAHRKREPFDIETGRPISWISKAAEVNWFDFAVEYVNWKWPRASGNTRKNMAKALTTATIALLRTSPPKHFDPVQVRRALREYAFNVNRRTDPEKPVPAEVQTILDWVQRNALSMSAWEKTENVDKVVTALGTLLDGTAAAASSITRNDRIMNLVMGYAIRHNYLKVNPLPKGKESAPRRGWRRLHRQTLPAEPRPGREDAGLDRQASASRTPLPGLLRRPLLRGAPSRGGRGPPCGRCHAAGDRVGRVPRP